MLCAEEFKEEFLRCSECQKEFDQENNIPRILSCLHTFCQNCLNQIVVQNSIVCPCCNTKCKLSSDGVQGLPKDVSRRNVVEFMKVKERTVDILCRDCPDDNQASSFCRDCYIYMCTECTNTHRRSVASQNHTVLTFDELKSSGSDSFKRKLKCAISGHEGQPLEFFCSKPECKSLICTKCIVPDHDESRGHVIKSVIEYHAEKTSKLQGCLNVMDESIKVSNISVQQMKQDLVNMDIGEYETEKEIDKCFNACFKVLENRRLEIKKQFSSIFHTKRTELQCHVNKVENFLGDIINARDFLQNMLKHTDPTEFLSLYRTFRNRQKTLSNQDIDMNRDFKMPTFDPVYMGDEYLEIVCKLGKIDNAMSDVERCRMNTHNATEADGRNLDQMSAPSMSPRRNTNLGTCYSRLATCHETFEDIDDTDDDDDYDIDNDNDDLRLMSTSPVRDDNFERSGVQNSLVKTVQLGRDKLEMTKSIDKDVLKPFLVTRSKSMDLYNPLLHKPKTSRNVVLPALSKTPRKIQLAKSLTDLGSSLRSSNKDTNDKHFRNITCPGFVYDEQSVHQYRKVINGMILTNSVGRKNPQVTGTNLKNFRGVVGSRSFKYPGKFYYEISVNYSLIGELNSTNMVFEIGICRQNEIDTGYCVYNHQHGWSFSLQHCQDHQSLCQWSRHNGQCFSHVQLPSVDNHSDVKLHYGFLLDTENSKWTVIDCNAQKCLYKFQGVDCSKPLWPVFGCHWPSKVVVKMALVTGHDITLLPSCIRY